MDRWVEHVMTVVRAGHLERILLSHDVCLKTDLSIDGGCGFSYLFREFLPRLARAGLNDAELEQLVSVNPQRAMCY